MTTIEQDLEQLRLAVESMDAAAPERVGELSVGDVVRQGDIYLVRLESLPPGSEVTSRQLAPGTTQGSRHIVVGDCKVVEGIAEAIERANGCDIPPELIGPAFECRGECTVEHPEHGDKILPAGTVWGVTYQRDHAEEVRRVLD